MLSPTFVDKDVAHALARKAKDTEGLQVWLEELPANIFQFTIKFI
jgi:hypothetical protein